MRRAVISGLALVLLLAACGSEEGPDAASTPATTSSSEPPWVVLDGPLASCGPQPPGLEGVPFERGVLRDPAVGRIPSVTIGDGRTVAVLLHQTDGGGLCGWLEFAARIASESGLVALAIDLCDYGDAVCRPRRSDRSQTAAVEVAVRHAREDLGADRVVIVGASMGGAVALMAASTLAGVDAAVDLSGPVDWPGTGVVRGGRALRVPVLVAMAREEGTEEVRGARAIVAEAPRGSRFVAVAAGHGYELLPRLGEDVLAWIAGG